MEQIQDGSAVGMGISDDRSQGSRNGALRFAYRSSSHRGRSMFMKRPISMDHRSSSTFGLRCWKVAVNARAKNCRFILLCSVGMVAPLVADLLMWSV